MDSFFTSIPLAVDLLRYGIYMCGTIRKNKKQFPDELKKLPVKLLQGQYVARQSGNLVAVVWMDNKEVNVLSTNESVNQTDLTDRRQKDGTVRQITRPKIVTNYQNNFRVVDLCDQLRAKYPVGRSGKKWWKYIMHFLINICIIDGFILCTESYIIQPGPSRRKKRFTQLDFRVNLAMQLINGYSSSKKKCNPSLVIYPLNNSNSNAHLFTKLSRKRATCKYCPKHGDKKRKETSFGCVSCDKHFCSFICHSQYHALAGIDVTEE